MQYGIFASVSDCHIYCNTSYIFYEMYTKHFMMIRNNSAKREITHCGDAHTHTQREAMHFEIRVYLQIDVFKKQNNQSIKRLACNNCFNCLPFPKYQSKSGSEQMNERKKVQYCLLIII